MNDIVPLTERLTDIEKIDAYCVQHLQKLIDLGIHKPHQVEPFTVVYDMEQFFSSTVPPGPIPVRDFDHAVELSSFNPPSYTDIAPESSADLVLTFRNVHNWYMRGGGDEKIISAFKAFYKTLKPGGYLGVVDHRLAGTRDLSEQEASGYMRQDYVMKMAEKSGFTFIEESSINANVKDSSDHPKGVWTLPPSLRLGDEQKAHYVAIGESDRMTLLFQKPKK